MYWAFLHLYDGQSQSVWGWSRLRGGPAIKADTAACSSCAGREVDPKINIAGRVAPQHRAAMQGVENFAKNYASTPGCWQREEVPYWQTVIEVSVYCIPAFL